MTSATFFSSARTAQEIDDLEESLKNHENRIVQMNSSFETLLQRNLQLTELRHVLKESSVFFEQVSCFIYSR
jgi:V-type H+-transporting ATPase subunit a